MNDADSATRKHASSRELQSECTFVNVYCEMMTWILVNFLEKSSILRVLNHLSLAPKNEDAYEISIPFEDNNFDQQGGFYNQNDQNFDGQFRLMSYLSLFVF